MINLTTKVSLPLIEQAKSIFLYKNSNCYVTDKYLRKAKESLRDYSPGIVCYVITRRITNELEIDDTRYYYLIARNYWYYNWADIDHANVAKYKNSPGGGLDSEIVKHMLDPRTINLTLLVIAVPTKDEKIEFFTIPATLFKEFTDRHSTIHRGRFNHIDYGYAKEWLKAG